MAQNAPTAELDAPAQAVVKSARCLRASRAVPDVASGADSRAFEAIFGHPSAHSMEWHDVALTKPELLDLERIELHS